MKFPLWLPLFAAALPAQTLIWPGERIQTLTAEHLTAYVPAAAAEALRPLVAHADAIYGRMLADAHCTPSQRLRLLLGDWVDHHNGYSFVTPFPLVQVELAPAWPESTIFAGGGDLERTLVHEFAHQISNDRNHGLRGVLESVFGRVLPNDLLSFLLFYLSTPAHQTMPRFWQEGLAIWAETTYADPDSPFAGRGRDPLTHMVWRLDAAADALPGAADWRLTWHEWPFGNRAYSYGAAYTRWLEGRFGDRASVWRVVADQGRQWAFLFDKGPRASLGATHGNLLAAAARDLAAEQAAQLGVLRAAGVVSAERRTPADWRLGAPAWTADGSLQFAAQPPDGRARQHELQPDGTLVASSVATLALGGMRALPGGGLAFHDFTWCAQTELVIDGRRVGARMLQPDAGPRLGDQRTVVAIRLRDGGGQDLVVAKLDAQGLGEPEVRPSEGTPWSPALRPGDGGDLCWVETDRSGSRLVLGSLQASTRQVLWQVRGRILHPVWSPDGNAVFCCADHTGVANAYHLTVGTAPVVTPVTNTLGGVLACVPSPDGRTLAIVDHDHRGPFLGTLPNEPTSWAKVVPTLTLAWPAPVTSAGGAGGNAAMRPQPLPDRASTAARAESLVSEPYSGLAELRPRFWAPSTFAVPDGGYGVYGLASDPLFTEVVQAGVGVGLVEHEPVGFLAYDHLASIVEFGVTLGRSERTYGDAVWRSGEWFDYSETVTHGALRFGRGLYAQERTWLLYAAVGAADQDEVDDAAAEYAGGTFVGGKTPFRDTEHYAELTLGYDDSTFYPTSYAAEDGARWLSVFRHSGLGGDLERNLAFGQLGYT